MLSLILYEKTKYGHKHDNIFFILLQTYHQTDQIPQMYLHDKYC